jgi:hypothetical protein
VDDYTLSLQFPACDWSGYFLFSALAGEGACQAVNLGVSVGIPDAAEHGVPEWDGDPHAVLVIAAVICDGISYRWTDSESYTRSDLIYSRVGLDLQVADVIRIRGEWPYFELYFRDPVHDIVYELDGRAGYVHWVPDHIQANNLYSYVCFPDYAFGGTITVKGTEHRVEGLGGFDHVACRTRGSTRSPGVGFWHYDPIMWEGGHVSNGLFYLGRKGEPYIKNGMMTLPDGGYHPADRFEIEYLELGEGTANAGTSGQPQIVPRRWRARMEARHGVLTYETTPMEVTDPSGAVIIEPNVVFQAEGEFKSRTGGTIPMVGKGHNEYMGSALDPSRVDAISRSG